MREAGREPRHWEEPPDGDEVLHDLHRQLERLKTALHDYRDAMGLAPEPPSKQEPPA
jgi:hypothetical protein